MGSECNPSKRRYDISMSKRTRKPLNMEYSYGNRTMEMGSSKRETPDDLKGVVDDEVDQEEEEEENDLKGVDDAEVDQIEEENDHKSLKQLINSDEKSKVKTSEESRGRNSLGEHFTKEEKQLQLVKTQQQKGCAKRSEVQRNGKSLCQSSEPFDQDMKVDIADHSGLETYCIAINRLQT
ncbi:hypothetical protein JRO89_XS05G0166900 [Xanthoceras sorbifolium]|uniref:Uncharacterized protein n=1 Tax=Xanthoceras sorbifolium TaxID=99658 RepID=A0ABQ8I292_9ROSI|nr:hypothetical protein JRO89_XS05G0166900 [Xanthoceras sorbifolium]